VRVLGEHQLHLARGREQFPELHREARSPLGVDRMLEGSEEHGLPDPDTVIHCVTLFPTDRSIYEDRGEDVKKARRYRRLHCSDV
jgi:hypothetical protein